MCLIRIKTSIEQCRISILREIFRTQDQIRISALESQRQLLGAINKDIERLLTSALWPKGLMSLRRKIETTSVGHFEDFYEFKKHFISVFDLNVDKIKRLLSRRDIQPSRLVRALLLVLSYRLSEVNSSLRYLN